MKYQVTLVKNDLHGRWGLIPKGSEDLFDPFWNVSGIFHDVFEHYFEGNPYFPVFCGKNAFKLQGETCATGHMLLYRHFIDMSTLGRKDYVPDYIYDTIAHVEAGNGSVEFYTFDDNIKLTVPRYSEYIPGSILGMVMSDVEEVYKRISSWLKTEGYPKKTQSFNSALKRGASMAARILGKKPYESALVLRSFIDEWSEIVETPLENLWLEGRKNEGPRNLNGFVFYIDTTGILSIKVKALDEYNIEYPLTSLIHY